MSAVYLKHIEVKGLFGYRNVSWDVHQDLNILGGDNGSGKSTLFQICHSLLGWGYITDSRYAEKVDYVKLDCTNGWSLVWDKRYVSPGFKGQKGYSYHDVDGGRIRTDGNVLLQRSQAFDENGIIINADDFVGVIKTDLLSSFEQAILESQKTGKYEKSSDRTYLDVLLTENIGYRNRKLSQILYNSYIHPEETETENERHSYFLSAKDARYLTLFNRAMLTFFGESYQIKAGMEAQITLISKKTQKEIPYQELSLGEKEVLLQILRVSNTFDEPVVVWLDEPDLGLHVDWQTKLVKCLRSLNPNIQLFVSTHAPSMVEGNFGRVSEMSQITVKR